MTYGEHVTYACTDPRLEHLEEDEADAEVALAGGALLSRLPEASHRLLKRGQEEGVRRLGVRRKGSGGWGQEDGDRRMETGGWAADAA